MTGYLLRWIATLALATAPAPAMSIVKEFHAKGPVTDTLLPMTVLDDVVGFPIGLLLKRCRKRVPTLAVLLSGITATMLTGWLFNTFLLSGMVIAVIAAKKGFQLAGEIN